MTETSAIRLIFLSADFFVHLIASLRSVNPGGPDGVLFPAEALLKSCGLVSANRLRGS